MQALRHRDFRLLFAGQATSFVGDQVVFVALALFIVRRTGSASDLGLVLGAQSLTLVGLLLFGGAWADRGGGRSRVRIMIACDVARMALHGLLAALIFTGAVRIWQMVAIEALFGIARAFFQPAYTGLMPQTVPEDLIQQGRALSQSSENIAALVGPALATALVLGVGAGEAFAFDAATFVVSALLLVSVRPRARGEAPAAAAASVWHEIRLGWHEVGSRPWVWVTIAAYTGIVMVVYAFWSTLAPVVARRSYGGAGIFGVLVAVEGVGAVAAAFTGIVWRPRRPMRTGLLLALTWPLPGLELALRAPLALILPTALLTGFGGNLFMVWWETALAQHIPPHALSRVSSYDWFGSLALLPVGQVIAGPLAAGLGAGTVLGAGAVIGLALTAMALIPRSTRELTQYVPREVGVELGREG